MERDSSRTGRWATGIALILALVVGAVGGSVITAKTGRSALGGTTAVPVEVVASSPVAAAELSFASGFASIVSNVVPSVVNIASSKIVSNREEMSPFMDPLFRQFFGDQFRIPRERRERSLGSGVIINSEGYILTNNHVVEGASDITVALSNKREYKAKIIGTDPNTDIAVVKVDAQRLPVAVLGNSSNVRVGEFSLAVGSPFGLSQTVTLGIISATGRVNLGIEDYEDFIQTDAAINPGNSGGALVNARGELIGINTAIVSGASGNQGVGFAIPINMAREVMTQILKHGKVIRGYMGVWVQPVTPDLAKAFNLRRTTGVLLGDVEQGGPAARAGLKRGDVILAMNGEPIADDQAFRLRVAMTAPGTRVRLRVLQNGAERDVDVVLSELRVREERSEMQQERNEEPQVMQGLSVDNLSPGIARQLGLPSGTRGVVVTNVDSDSLAEEAGIQRGDVILEVNRRPVASVGEFRRAISGSGSSLLLINRGGNTLYVVVNF